jgi:hypothetical protein
MSTPTIPSYLKGVTNYASATHHANYLDDEMALALDQNKPNANEQLDDTAASSYLIVADGKLQTITYL